MFDFKFYLTGFIFKFSARIAESPATVFRDINVYTDVSAPATYCSIVPTYNVTGNTSDTVQ